MEREFAGPMRVPADGLASATALVHSQLLDPVHNHTANSYMMPPIIGEVDLRLLPRWRIAHEAFDEQAPPSAPDDGDPDSTVDSLVEMTLPPLISTAVFLVLALMVVWLFEWRKGLKPESRWHAMVRFFLDQPAATPAADLKLPRSSSSPALLPAEEDLDAENIILGCHRSFWIDARDLLLCAFGVVGIFMIYGVYQESVMTRTYYNAAHPKGERFTGVNMLTFVNRLFAVMLALVLLGLVQVCCSPGPANEQWQKRASIWEYAIGGYTNTISSVCQYGSIHFISFPVLVLSKACKMPTVMLANFACYGQQYVLFDWMASLVVLMGALLFLLYDGDAAHKHEGHIIENNVGGLVLVIIFLAADAYTSTWQSATFKKDTAILPMMLLLSVWGAFFSLVGLISSDELVETIGFFSRNPAIIIEAVVLSITSAVGQLFILITIRRFGPLTFAALATVRQLVSAILSIIIFNHLIHMLQIVGLMLTFAALGSTVRYKMHERALRIAQAKTDAAAAKKTDAASADAASADAEALAPWVAPAWEGSVGPKPGERDYYWYLGAVWVAAGLVVVVFVVKSLLTLVMLKKTQEHDENAIHTTGVAYSAVSSACTILWLMILFMVQPTCFQPIPRPSWAIFGVIGLVSVADLALTNVAISILDPPQQQCLAALAPVFTFVVESTLKLEFKQPIIVFFVCVIAAGASVATLTHMAVNQPLDKYNDQALGMVAMIVASLLSGCKLVLLRASSMTFRTQMSPIATLFWVDTMVFLVLTPLSIGLGEMLTLVDAITLGPPILSVGVAFTGALGGVRFLSELYALQYMQAVDLSIVNTFAAICYVLLCFVIFPSDVHHSGVVQWTNLYIGSISATFTGLVGYVLAVRHYWPDRLVFYKCGKGCLDELAGGAKAEAQAVKLEGNRAAGC